MRGRDKKPASVETLLGELPQDQRSLYGHLRERLLSEDGISETLMWDGFVDEWVPCFRLPEGMLFHIHTGRQLSATMTLSTQRACPRVEVDPGLSPTVKAHVRDSPDYDGTKWVDIPLGGPAEVEAFLPLVRLKGRLLVEQRQGRRQRPS